MATFDTITVYRNKKPFGFFEFKEPRSELEIARRARDMMHSLRITDGADDVEYGFTYGNSVTVTGDDDGAEA